MSNKHPWLIDGEVLEVWLFHFSANLNDRQKELYEGKEYETAARMDARFRTVGSVIEQLQSGRFNVKDKEQSILKVGDMVRHLLHPEWEAAAIKRISASGKSVFVYFPRHYGTYLVKHLDKVSDIDPTARLSEAEADKEGLN